MSGSSPWRCLDLRIHQALNAFPPQSLKAQVKTARFGRKAPRARHTAKPFGLKILHPRLNKVQRESETTKIQQNCFEVTVLHQYNMKFDLKNPTCVCPYPSNTLSKRSETSTLGTHQSNLLLQSHRDTKQTSPEWKETSMQILRSSFQSTSATASKTFIKIRVLWSRSDLDLGLYSLFLALTLWFWSSHCPTFAIPIPPPPSWQLYELLILEEMHRNVTS